MVNVFNGSVYTKEIVCNVIKIQYDCKSDIEGTIIGCGVYGISIKVP